MGVVFTWYERKHRVMLTPVHTLRVGSWDVGYIGYDWATSSHNRGAREVAYVCLPGLPQNQGNFGTVKEAKRSVEKAVTWWFYHCIDREALTTATKHITRTRSTTEPVAIRRVRTRPSAGPERVRRTRS